MTTVYAVASPAPVLYAIPAALHPTATTVLSGPVFTPNPARRVYRDRGSLRHRLTIVGRAKVTVSGGMTLTLGAAIALAPLRSAASCDVRATRAGHGRITTGAARQQHTTARCHPLSLRARGTHVHTRAIQQVPWPVFDLLFESWDL